jgi:hypothetical protein
LKHEPEPELAFRVRELECVDRETANEVPGEHANGGGRGRQRSHWHGIGGIGSARVGVSLGGGWVGAVPRHVSCGVGRLGHVPSVCVDLRHAGHDLRHVHGRALHGRRIRGRGAARDADGRGAAAVAHEIDLAGAVGVPEIDRQDEEGAVDVVGVNVLAGDGIGDDQAHAGRRCDGTAVLPVVSHLSPR